MYDGFGVSFSSVQSQEAINFIQHVHVSTNSLFLLSLRQPAKLAISSLEIVLSTQSHKLLKTFVHCVKVTSQMYKLFNNMTINYNNVSSLLGETHCCSNPKL